MSQMQQQSVELFFEEDYTQGSTTLDYPMMSVDSNGSSIDHSSFLADYGETAILKNFANVEYSGTHLRIFYRGKFPARQTPNSIARRDYLDMEEARGASFNDLGMISEDPEDEIAHEIQPIDIAMDVDNVVDVQPDVAPNRHRQRPLQPEDEHWFVGQLEAEDVDMRQQQELQQLQQQQQQQLQDLEDEIEFDFENCMEQDDDQVVVEDDNDDNEPEQIDAILGLVRTNIQD